VFYHGAQNEMSVFAEYYGLPVLSVRACCWRLMAANVTGVTLPIMSSVTGCVTCQQALLV
jgi:hypothetical protein